MNIVKETEKYQAKVENLRVGFIAKLSKFIESKMSEVKACNKLIEETGKLKDEAQSNIAEARSTIKETK